MRKWKIVKLMLFLIDNCHTMLGLKRFHLYAHVYLPSSFECYPSLFLWLTWWLLNLLSRYLLWILRNDYGLQTKRSRANTISNLHCRHLRIRILARQIHEHLSYFVNLLHFGSGRSEQNTNITENYSALFWFVIAFPSRLCCIKAIHFTFVLESINQSQSITIMFWHLVWHHLNYWFVVKVIRAIFTLYSNAHKNQSHPLSSLALTIENTVEQTDSVLAMF